MRLFPAVLVVRDAPCVFVAHVLFPMFFSTAVTLWHAGEPQPDAEWSLHGERLSTLPRSSADYVCKETSDTNGRDTAIDSVNTAVPDLQQ